MSLVKIAGMQLGPDGRKLSEAELQRRFGYSFIPTIPDLCKHSRVYANRILGKCKKDRQNLGYRYQ